MDIKSLYSKTTRQAKDKLEQAERSARSAKTSKTAAKDEERILRKFKVRATEDFKTLPVKKKTRSIG